MRHEKVELYTIHFDGVPDLNRWCELIENAGGVYISGKSIGRQCVIVYAGTAATQEAVTAEGP
ncbi:MAG: hypothetical protein H0T51_15150 [Pirellulales bacterium]|nr:hypothetical protein [Pirellulales bacterium]